MTKIAFAKLGIFWETEGGSIRIPAGQELKVSLDMGGMIPKIDDAPWPGFPPDLISIAVVVATQVRGTILIHEKMFESRMFFVDKLIGMGAQIIDHVMKPVEPSTNLLKRGSLHTSLTISGLPW